MRSRNFRGESIYFPRRYAFVGACPRNETPVGATLTSTVISINHGQEIAKIRPEEDRRQEGCSESQEARQEGCEEEVTEWARAPTIP